MALLDEQDVAQPAHPLEELFAAGGAVALEAASELVGVAEPVLEAFFYDFCDALDALVVLSRQTEG